MPIVRQLVAVIFMLALVAPAASAQTSRGVEIGGHVGVLRLSDFDVTDMGVGATGGWYASPAFGVEGAFTWFPGSEGLERPRIEQQDRLLGLFGVRSGVKAGSVELFGRARAGFLRFSRDEDAVCIAIAVFPLPLECQLLEGYTAFTSDLGVGVSVAASDRVLFRLDAGDLIVRYGQESLRPNGERTSGLTSHNLLLTAGASIRF